MRQGSKGSTADRQLLISIGSDWPLASPSPVDAPRSTVQAPDTYGYLYG